MMSSRKRIAIQLTRQQISRILQALTRDDDLALRLSLREARSRFGDQREAGKGPGWLIPDAREEER
jgi:hypothetical protein